MDRTVLALDCATEYCSVSLLVNGKVFHRIEQVGNQHSGVILPWIDALIGEAGIVPADIDGVIFGAGPGSFTGVRIACGVAQGLAWGIDAPVLPLCNLQAAAWPALKEGADVVAVVNDARMSECYGAIYERVDGLVKTRVAPMLLKPEAVAAWARENGASCVLGTGAKAYEIENLPQSRHTHSDANDMLALWQANAAQFEDQWVKPALASPLYVRNRVALTIKEREQGERL